MKGKKGHFPETIHLELLTLVKPLIPADCPIIFLGDGEFDGDDLSTVIDQAGWQYVVRTAKNRLIDDEGDHFRLDEVGLQSGQCLGLCNVQVGATGIRCPLVIAWWRKGCETLIYLLTNHDCVDEACYWYGKRYTIETFFSDQKSRGFNLHRTHLADPERVTRLLIAAVLAYFWVIYLGAIAVQEQLDTDPFIRLTDVIWGYSSLEYVCLTISSIGLDLPDIKTVR